MAGYDPRFWELPFDPGDLEWIPADPMLDEESRSPAGARRKAEVKRALGDIVRTRLTERQREIVELYFFEGHTQQAIAEQLGISQQSVSRQLFGAIRNGQRVGGAIQRLRKIAAEMGWDPEKWV